MLSTIRWFQQRFSYWVDGCILMDFVFLRGFVDLVLTHMISFRVLPPFASDYLECFALLHVAYVLSAAFPTFSLVRYLSKLLVVTNLHLILIRRAQLRARPCFDENSSLNGRF